MADYGRITLIGGVNYFLDNKGNKTRANLKQWDTGIDAKGNRNMWDGSKWVPMAEVTTNKVNKKKVGNFTYYNDGKKGYWRRADGSKMVNGNRIKFGEGNYKQFNSDGSITDIMVNGKFTDFGNKLSDEEKQHMSSGHVYDKAISDVNGQVYSRARSIRTDLGKHDLANNTYTGWREDLDFNTDLKSYKEGVSYDKKREEANKKAIEFTKSYKPQPSNWFIKAKSNTTQKNIEATEARNFNDFLSKELSKDPKEGTGYYLLKPLEIDYTTPFKDLYFPESFGETTITEEDPRLNNAIQKYVNQNGIESLQNAIKGLSILETSRSLLKGADNLAKAGVIGMVAPVALYATTQIPAGLLLLKEGFQSSTPYRLYNIMKAGKTTGGIWSHIALNTARKSLSLAGLYGGYVGSLKLADKYVLPYIENENLKLAVGLGITGTGMALGGGSANLVTSMLRPKGRTLEFLKSGLYDMAHGVADNLKFATAYGTSSYIPGVKDSELAKFALSSSLHGGLNYTTSKFALKLNNSINGKKDELIERIYDIKSNPFSNTKLGLLSNAEKSVSKLDKASKAGERINKVLNGQQNYVGYNGGLVRHLYSGVPQTVFGYGGMNLVGTAGQAIDNTLGTNITQTPLFEFATMIMGNKIGKELLNIGSYGLRSGSGGDTSIGRVTTNEASAARYNLGKTKKLINKVTPFFDPFNLKEIEKDLGLFRQFTGNLLLKGDLPSQQILHTTTKNELHMVERINHKLASMLKYGYSAGQYDPISMNKEGVTYLGAHLEGRNPSISENASTKEIVSGMNQYLAGKRLGGAYHDYVTERGLKGLENFDLLGSKFLDKQGNVHDTFVKIDGKYYINPKAKRSLLSERQNDFDLTDPFKVENGKEYVIQSNVAGHKTLPLVDGKSNSIIKYGIDTNGYGDTVKSYNSQYKGLEGETSIFRKMIDKLKGIASVAPGLMLDDTSSPLHLSHVEVNPTTLLLGYGTQGNLPMNTVNQIKGQSLPIRKILIRKNIEALSTDPTEIYVRKNAESRENALYMNNFRRNFGEIIDEIPKYLELPLKMVGTTYEDGVYKANSSSFGKTEFRNLKKKVVGHLPRRFGELFDLAYTLGPDKKYHVNKEKVKELLDNLRAYYKETGYLKTDKGMKKALSFIKKLSLEEEIKVPKAFKERAEQLKGKDIEDPEVLKLQLDLTDYYNRGKIDKVLGHISKKVNLKTTAEINKFFEKYISDNLYGNIYKKEGGKLEKLMQYKTAPKKLITWEEYQKQNRK